jgi:hypothetical protein
MTFYLNFLSLLVLGAVYSVCIAVIAPVIYKCRGNRRLMFVFVPLSVAILIAPIAEELWISWNFYRFCSRDAGVQIHKTVVVDGYFDSTTDTDVSLVTSSAAKYLDERGFSFYEMTLPDGRGDPKKIVHFEKANGLWKANVQNQPSARYHYFRPETNKRIAHKVSKNSELVLDSITGEAIATSTRYGRLAPWYFIALDVSGMACPSWSSAEEVVPGTIYKLVFTPAKNR